MVSGFFIFFESCIFFSKSVFTYKLHIHFYYVFSTFTIVQGKTIRVHDIILLCGIRDMHKLSEEVIVDKIIDFMINKVDENWHEEEGKKVIYTNMALT